MLRILLKMWPSDPSVFLALTDCTVARESNSKIGWEMFISWARTIPLS